MSTQNTTPRTVLATAVALLVCTQAVAVGVAADVASVPTDAPTAPGEVALVDAPDVEPASDATAQPSTTDHDRNSTTRQEPESSVTVPGEEEHDYRVHLFPETVVPEEGLDERLLDAETEHVYALVQLRDEPADVAEPLPLSGQVGTVEEWSVEWLSPTARYARLPREHLQEFAEQDRVRSVRAIQPAWRLSPYLRTDYEEGITDARPIVVTAFEPIEHEGLEQPEVPDELAGDTRSDVERYYGELDAEQVRELMEHPRVKWIEPLQPVESTTDRSRRLVGADYKQQDDGSGTYVGEDPREQYDGTGVQVGVLDSGLDFSHTHFSRATLVRSIDWLDTNAFSQDWDPEAAGAHGTHVAGTIAGIGPAPGSEDPFDRQYGVAPNATLVISRLLNENGVEEFGNGVKLAKALKPKLRYQVLAGTVTDMEIMSNSWGLPFRGTYGILADSTDEWAYDNDDTLMVFAAGNFPDDKYVVAPGLGVNVLSVGATREGTTVNSDGVFTSTNESFRKINSVSDLSRTRAPRDTYNNVFYTSDRKSPLVMAPGEWITGPVPGGAYDNMQGTSMATPHVSGVAALLQEKYPSYNANEHRATIVGTTNPVEPNERSHRQGYGVVDAHNALFENVYESSQTLLEPDQPLQDWQADVYTFSVPSGAYDVQTTLSWLDPTVCACARDVLKNDVDLYVGPADVIPANPTYDDLQDVPDQYKLTGETNVKKFERYNPKAGTWRVVVFGNSVANKQDYDVLNRVTTMDTGQFSVTGNDIAADLGKSSNGTVTIEGEGAPTPGTYVTLEDTSEYLYNCGQKRWFVGGLSHGRAMSFEPCFTSNVRGKHTATFNVNYTDRDGDHTSRQSDVEVTIKEDKPPEAVPNLSSPTHRDAVAFDRWTNDLDIRVTWDRAKDNGKAGLSHYLVSFNTNDSAKPLPYQQGASTQPFHVTTLGETFVDWKPGVPGDGEYYFHIRAVDNDDNVGPVSRIGPFKIDTESPNRTTVAPNETVYTKWGRYDLSLSEYGDNRSAIAAHDWRLCNGTGQYGCTDATTFDEGTHKTPIERSDRIALRNLPEGGYTFVVTPRDRAGNTGPSTTVDVVVDTTRPDANITQIGRAVTGGTSFSASASSDDVGIEEYRWDFGDYEEQTTTSPSVTHQYDKSGTYYVYVTVHDLAGNRDSASVKVQVGEGVDLDNLGVRENYRFDGLEPDRWSDRDIPRPESVENAMIFERIGVKPSEPDDLDIEVVGRSTPPEDAPAFDRRIGEPGTTQYLVVGHEEPYDGQARLQVSVGQEALDANGLGPEQVGVYRYSGEETDGQWVETETSYLGSEDGRHRYEAQSDGLSVFAIGTASESGEQESTAGEETTETPVTEETTETPVTEETTEAPVTEETTEAPDDVRTEAPDTETTVAVTLGEETLTVETAEETAAGTTETTAVGPTAPSPGTTPSGTGPGFGLSLAVVAIGLAVALARRRS